MALIWAMLVTIFCNRVGAPYICMYSLIRRKNALSGVLKGLANSFVCGPLSFGFLLLTHTAAANNTVDMGALTLEELLNIKISTVSKRPELALKAAGIVTVVTARDIRAYGATNVKDILSRIPNLFIFDSSTFSSSGVSLRAGATQHLNNHVLYLVNGRPLRESQNGGLHTDINLLFPVEAIERIEVVRGPGSVLYGSNAYSGTINFITKQANDGTQASIGTRMGSYAYKRVDGSVVSKLGERGSVALYAQALDSNGATIRAVDGRGHAGYSDLSRNGGSAFFAVSYGGLTLNSIVSDIELPFVSGTFNWDNLIDWRLKRRFLDIGYTHDVNERWTASINYTSNQSDRLGAITSEYQSNGQLYEFTVNGTINNSVSVVFGAVLDSIQGGLGNFGGDYESNKRSVYAQVDYRWTEQTSVTVGVQSNKFEGQAVTSSPRLALVHSFNKPLTLKLLYSEAYRSPFGSELFFDSPFLQGNTSLKPERVRTSEAQVSFAKASFLISAACYHSVSSYSIGRERVNGSTIFVNEPGSISFNGLEVEGKWELANSWEVNGSATFQQNEDEAGQKDFMLAPRTMIKIGANRNFSGGYHIGIWNSFYSGVGKAETLQGNSVAVVNPPASAFSLLSINIEANLGRLLNTNSLNAVDATIYANNILGQEVHYPELGYRQVNTYPQSYHRGLFFGLKASF